MEDSATQPLGCWQAEFRNFGNVSWKEKRGIHYIHFRRIQVEKIVLQNFKINEWT